MNDKTEHTPGPWAHCDGLKQNYIHRQGEGIPICLMSACFDGRKQELANARLIAAAPELLEALKALVCACDEGCSTEGKYMAGLARDAHDAINKATQPT